MFSYQFHIRDYLTKTRHLSLIEDLAYRRLLDTYYTEEKPLPADAARCARLIAMPEHGDAVELVLKEFFTLSAEGWVNERADAEIVKYHAKADSARSANAKRWQSRSEQKPEQKPEPKPDLKSDLNSDADQIATINQEPRTKSSSTAAAAGVDLDLFAAFWSAYPRKVAKPEAMKAWLKLKPDAELAQQIMDGLARAKQSRDWTKDDGQFIPHPTTWLNQHRWEDELDTVGSDDATGGTWL